MDKVKDSKVLQVKKIPFNSSFEENFNKFAKQHPDVKSVQFKKTDKYCSICLYWYWEKL